MSLVPAVISGASVVVYEVLMVLHHWVLSGFVLVVVFPDLFFYLCRNFVFTDNLQRNLMDLMR